MVVHELAIQAKITVPNAFIKNASLPLIILIYPNVLTGQKTKSGFIYASAMTLLQRTDGDDADSGVSYLDLVSFIKSECADTTANLGRTFSAECSFLFAFPIRMIITKSWISLHGSWLDFITGI